MWTGTDPNGSNYLWWTFHKFSSYNPPKCSNSWAAEELLTSGKKVIRFFWFSFGGEVSQQVIQSVPSGQGGDKYLWFVLFLEFPNWKGKGRRLIWLHPNSSLFPEFLWNSAQKSSISLGIHFANRKGSNCQGVCADKLAFEALVAQELPAYWAKLLKRELLKRELFRCGEGVSHRFLSQDSETFPWRSDQVCVCVGGSHRFLSARLFHDVVTPYLTMSWKLRCVQTDRRIRTT